MSLSGLTVAACKVFLGKDTIGNYISLSEEVKKPNRVVAVEI